MTPYAQRYVRPETIALFQRIRSAVLALPDIDLGWKTEEDPEGIVLSCHMVARAVAAVFPGLRCVDGRFNRAWEHSWVQPVEPQPLPGFVTGALHLPSATMESVLLDVYPIAILGGPILLETGFGSPWHRLYQEEVLRNSISWEGFSEACAKVEVVLREVVETQERAGV